jgi:hypothetical protein
MTKHNTTNVAGQNPPIVRTDAERPTDRKRSEAAKERTLIRNGARRDKRDLHAWGCA